MPPAALPEHPATVLVDLARLGETQSFSLLANGYRTWGPAVKG